MTIRPVVALLIFCFLILIYSPSSAQKPGHDSISLSAIQQNLTSIYYKAIRENAPIFNGAEYTGHGQGIQGHPFFESADFIKGWIEYDGVLYQDVPMKFDMIDETVIINDFTNNYFIKLNNKKIRSFSLGQFVFIQPTLYDESPEGFYQLVLDGDVMLFARKTKKVEYRTNVERTIFSYVPYTRFFLKKEGKYSTVSGQNDLLRIMKDKRSELRRFITENKLSYKRNPEELFIKTVAYYNQTKSRG